MTEIYDIHAVERVRYLVQASRLDRTVCDRIWSATSRDQLRAIVEDLPESDLRNAMLGTLEDPPAPRADATETAA